MPMHTPIAEVMSTKLQTANVGDSLEQVRDLLRSNSFHHVPILEGQHLVGIISSRDLVRIYREDFAAGPGSDRSSESESPTVATTMQTDLVTMRSDQSVDKAIDLLADGAIHSVLVLDEDDELVGITTNIDLLEYLFA
jgi:acetoin utilization protein AcuB